MLFKKCVLDLNIKKWRLRFLTKNLTCWRKRDIIILYLITIYLYVDQVNSLHFAPRFITVMCFIWGLTINVWILGQSLVWWIPAPEKAEVGPMVFLGCLSANTEEFECLVWGQQQGRTAKIQDFSSWNESV